MKCTLDISRSLSLKYSQKTPHSSPVRASYGVSFFSSPPVPYAISRNIGPPHNESGGISLHEILHDNTSGALQDSGVSKAGVACSRYHETLIWCFCEPDYLNNSVRLTKGLRYIGCHWNVYKSFHANINIDYNTSPVSVSSLTFLSANGITAAPFCEHGLTDTMAWISNYILCLCGM